MNMILCLVAPGAHNWVHEPISKMFSVVTDPVSSRQTAVQPDWQWEQRPLLAMRKDAWLKSAFYIQTEVKSHKVDQMCILFNGKQGALCVAANPSVPVGKRILCSDPSKHFPDEIMNFSALAHFEKNIKPIF